MQPEGPEILHELRSTADAPSSAGRLLGLTSVLGLLITVWWLSGISDLLHRPFWMDEVHTWLLVNDDDVWRSVQALADGVDFNPPGYFVLARISRFFPGEDRELVLRGLSAGLMLSAAAAMYLLTVRACGPLAAGTATLMFGGHALILHQLTEVRFYAAWVAALSWLCVLLQYSAAQQTRMIRVIGKPAMLVLTSFVCLCHYFGIISVGLVVITRWITVGTKSDRRLLTALLVTGMATTASCYPLLVGQRQALTRATWISSPTPESSLQFLNSTMPWIPISILLLTVLCLRRLRGVRSPDFRGFMRCAAIPGSGLIMLPLTLVAFSWVIQPALVPRYATAGLIGLVPVVASLLSQLPRRLQWIAASLTLMLIPGNGWNCVEAWQQFTAVQNQLIDEIDALPNESLVLFEDRTMWLPVVHRRPDLRDRCQLVDFEVSQMSVDSSLRVVQRDAGRKIQAWYPQFRMLHLANLEELPQFWVVPYQGGSDRDLLYPPNFLLQRYSKLMFCSQRSGYGTDIQQQGREAAAFFQKIF